AASPQWCSGVALAADVDVLIHDAQYNNDEYLQRVGWGHSTLEHAISFAELAGVKKIMPFHYDPAHDDTMLDRSFTNPPLTRRDPSVLPAREGETVDVAGSND